MTAAISASLSMSSNLFVSCALSARNAFASKSSIDKQAVVFYRSPVLSCLSGPQFFYAFPRLVAYIVSVNAFISSYTSYFTSILLFGPHYLMAVSFCTATDTPTHTFGSGFWMGFLARITSGMTCYVRARRSFTTPHEQDRSFRNTDTCLRLPPQKERVAPLQ